MATLLTQYQLKHHTVKNRLVVPPIVCFGYAGKEGYVSEKHIKHYERLAGGGAGIVIAEAACVSKDARLSEDQLGIWDNAFIPGLSGLASVIHSHNAVALIQIHHAGTRVDRNVSDTPLAPSDMTTNDGRRAKALTLEQIADISEDFTRAALRAKEAGFDGVELHACHKYLICQFLSPITNKRRDEYGADKAKFASDIIGNIRRACGGEFIIGVRMGGNDPDLKGAIRYARAFEEAGADILHISTGYKDYKPQDLDYTENEYYNWIVRSGIVIERNVHIPVIVVNGVRKPEQAAYIIEEGLADFVAAAKGLLVDEAWLAKIQNNEPVVLCDGCRRCRWFIKPETCPHYRV
ncbi:MAG: NADH:flavin oxidoreductase [Clostridiales bacterium]|jgi:2,4-dienoyl-CoA reductase-like NADH-dependent reductase (Old Yellow Enzyme family)|nr:NADH:flavin oxidoreductase [Clostridiales bacterium]